MAFTTQAGLNPTSASRAQEGFSQYQWVLFASGSVSAMLPLLGVSIYCFTQNTAPSVLPTVHEVSNTKPLYK